MGQQPTLADFQGFIQNVMGVPETALDPSAPIVGYCFDFALNTVSRRLAHVPSVVPPGSGWTVYQLAVYNLAADTLANWAQDAPGAPVYADGKPYWAWLQDKYGLTNFVAGVLSSASDESTSASYQLPEAFSRLTLANLANLKTPWGRTYLGLAQDLGSVWGLN